MMKYSFFLIFFIFIENAFSQNKNINSYPIEMIAEHEEGSTWYKLNKGININKENINSNEVKKYFGIDTNGSFKLVQEETDEKGNSHHKFLQLYKNIPVQFGTITIHIYTDGRQEISGKFIRDLNANISTNINSLEAVQKAKEYFPATTYMWDDSIENEVLRKQTGKIDTTYFPVPQLVWTNVNTHQLKADSVKLAYKFLICGKEPFFLKEVHIDANTGKLIHAYEKNYTCGSPTFISNFYSTQTAKDHYKSAFPSGNIMVDSFCNIGDVIHVSDNSNLNNPYNTFPGLVWANNNNINSAFTSMWAIRKAEEYYNTVHGRLNGFDESIFNVDLRQNASFGVNKFNNASFNQFGICKVGNSESAIGSSNSFVQDDWNSLDILAHELTHGVTDYEANLIYEKESGALNESFSDIFGVNVYLFNFPLLINDPNIWKVAYDMLDTNFNHTPLRDMSNPESFGDPATYLTSPNWYNVVGCNPNDTTGGGNDLCGVHSNSGVQNKMYHLLVKGGTGINANGFNYNVLGIGINAARAIAYKTLTTPGYLSQNALHPEARDAWVHAAVDLYGFCSVEAIAVGKAWEAVGVGSYIYLNNNYCGTVGASSNISITGSPAAISPSNCGYTVQPTGNYVEINAYDNVNVYPGFTAQNGSNFKITTNGNCNYSNY